MRRLGKRKLSTNQQYSAEKLILSYSTGGLLEGLFHKYLLLPTDKDEVVRIAVTLILVNSIFIVYSILSALYQISFGLKNEIINTVVRITNMYWKKYVLEKYCLLLGILFEMRLLNLSINFIADFCPHLGSFYCFSHYVSAKFHLWPSSSD